jgi:hypothetical protein
MDISHKVTHPHAHTHSTASQYACRLLQGSFCFATVPMYAVSTCALASRAASSSIAAPKNQIIWLKFTKGIDAQQVLHTKLPVSHVKRVAEQTDAWAGCYCRQTEINRRKNKAIAALACRSPSAAQQEYSMSSRQPFLTVAVSNVVCCGRAGPYVQIQPSAARPNTFCKRSVTVRVARNMPPRSTGSRSQYMDAPHALNIHLLLRHLLKQVRPVMVIHVPCACMQCSR